MWINQEVLAKADSQIGYRPGGPEQGKFCDWYGRTANWCAMGTTWAFYEALGVHAKAVIGVQSDAPLGRGWSYTVTLRNWLQANGRPVNINDLTVGDLLFFKYPTTGDRDTQIVNHVEIVEHVSAGYITTIGFNTIGPGVQNLLSNRGVYRVTYPKTNSRIVDAYRPPWHRYPGIGYISSGRSAEEIQDILRLEHSGVYDENTRWEVRKFQQFLNSIGYDLEVDGLWGFGTNEAYDDYMATAQRLSGKDRYATSVEISQAAWPVPNNVHTVYLARGDLFADALSLAGSLSGQSALPPGPVLLVSKTLSEVVRAEIQRLKPNVIMAAGGTDVVSDAVLQAAKKAAES